MAKSFYEVKVGDVFALSYTEFHEPESVVCVALVDFNMEEVANEAKCADDGVSFSKYLLAQGFVKKKEMVEFYLGDDDEISLSASQLK